jgi:tetratricopeptide (TPR) repeat protein
MRYLCGFIFVLALGVMGCSETSGTGGSRGDDGDGGTLPWPSPFIEPGYSQPQVIEQATALRDEYAELIEASMRDELTTHIAMLFAASPAESAKEEGSLTIDPETESEAWNMAGVSAVFQGSLEVASWCFANAVLADPADAQALNQLGWVLLAGERLEEAKGVLLHAAEVEPRLWSIWSNLGHAYDISDDPERAMYYFGRGLEYHPESLNMHLRLGGLRLERGDIIAAAAHAAHALAISPKDPEAQDFADEVAAAGGDTATPGPAPPWPSGGGMSEVLADFDDCVADAAQRYAQDMAPFVSHLVDIVDMEHYFRMAGIQRKWSDCEADCGPDRLLGCFNACLSEYCGLATLAEVSNHMAHLHVASIDMSYNAAFRTRMRGCAFNAVETYEDSVSEESIQDFIVYVGWRCEAEAEGSVEGFKDDQASIANRLPVASGCPDVSEIPVEELSLSFDLESLGFSIGMETCLDRIVCIAQGETAFGIDVGIDIVSAGVDINWGTPDIVFSLGVGKEVLGIGSVGISAKLSLRNGIGVSPSAKFGGIVRTTVSRDIWLISF